MLAVISSSHDQPQSEVPTSTPHIETQAMYTVSYQEQEQQPERTPSNVHHQQDQGNVIFHYTNENYNWRTA